MAFYIDACIIVPCMYRFPTIPFDSPNSPSLFMQYVYGLYIHNTDIRDKCRFCLLKKTPCFLPPLLFLVHPLLPLYFFSVHTLSYTSCHNQFLFVTENILTFRVRLSQAVLLKKMTFSSIHFPANDITSFFFITRQNI